MRTTLWIGIGLLLLVAWPRSEALAAPGAGQIGLWKLTGLGVDSREVTNIRKALTAAFRRNRDWRWLRRRTVEARLNAAGITSVSATEEAVKALKAQYVLVGMLAGLGDEINLDLKLLDGSTAAEVRRVSIVLPSSRAGLATFFDELVVRLMAPEKWVGGIGLQVTVNGAEIWLDGELIARSPLKGPLMGLKPGKHALTIRKEGYEEFSEFVLVQYDKLTREKVDLRDGSIERSLLELNPEPSKKPDAKPKPRTSQLAVTASSTSSWKQVTAWSCLGGAAAFGLAAALVGWSMEDVNQRLQDGNWDQDNESDLQELIDTGNERADLANGLLVACSVATAASLAFFVWDLSSGDTPGSTAVTITTDGRSLVLAGRF